MKTTTIGFLRIGTSNIVVPGNKTTFPKQYQNKTRLNYYSSFFNTVELNSTFYKLSRCSTFQRWAEEVPFSFRFSVKLQKTITHVKDLEYSPGEIERFLKTVACLEGKMGCLLLQFPGKISFEYFTRVEEILHTINDSAYSSHWEKAVEFRSTTWYVGETFELLEQQNASLVMHDFPQGRNEQPGKTARFKYVRLHGPEGNYRGSYSNEYLIKMSKNIKAWLGEGKNVYIYFNNTVGDAFDNARRLRDICNA